MDIQFENELRDNVDKLIFLSINLRRRTLEKIGLYNGQPLILKLIEENPGLSQREFAEIAKISPPTLNVMLGRLAKKELVEIKHDESNLKISKVYLTAKGKEKSIEAQEQLTNFKNCYYSDLTEKEKETFENLLNKINNNLENKFKEV